MKNLEQKPRTKGPTYFYLFHRGIPDTRLLFFKCQYRQQPRRCYCRVHHMFKMRTLDLESIHCENVFRATFEQLKIKSPH